MYPSYAFVRDDRFGEVLVPLLLGGLAGGAIVSTSRPRPVIAFGNPVPMPGPGPMPMPPMYGPSYYPYY